MIEIRFHGRGGQGAVVASKIMANAVFLALSVLVVMELHKVLVRWLAARHKPGKLAV